MNNLYKQLLLILLGFMRVSSLSWPETPLVSLIFYKCLSFILETQLSHIHHLSLNYLTYLNFLLFTTQTTTDSPSLLPLGHCHLYSTITVPPLRKLPHYRLYRAEKASTVLTLHFCKLPDTTNYPPMVTIHHRHYPLHNCQRSIAASIALFQASQLKIYI